jgi:hypothetical protein
MSTLRFFPIAALGLVALACGGEFATVSPGSDASQDALTDPTAPDAGGGDHVAGDCVPEPAPNWWPVALANGASTNPSCPADYADAATAQDGLSWRPATCGCTCVNPGGVSCSIPFGYGCNTNGTTCPSALSWLTLNAATCANTPGTVCPGSCGAECTGFIATGAPVATGGSCAPQPNVTKPEPSWSNTVALCKPTRLTAEGCAPSQVRMPKRDGYRRCIVQEGATVCPPGEYSERHVEYRAVTDTRACSACTCGAASGVSCGGSVSWAGGFINNCPGNPLSMAPSTSCQSGQRGQLFLLYTPKPSGGSCAATPGQPVGDVSPALPLTVCCLP